MPKIVKNHKKINYDDFVEKLKAASNNEGAYLPQNFEDFINMHGKAIYQAYLYHIDLKNKGVLSFFTAQTIEAILFQIVIKKIHENLIGNLSENCKLMRGGMFAVNDIETLAKESGREKSDYWLSVSSNIFDFSHGESWAFFLAGGISQSKPKDIFPILENALKATPYSLSEQKARGLIHDIQSLWSSYLSLLPSSILEVVVIHDNENFQKCVRISEPYATNLRRPDNYGELLNADDVKIQARVLATTPQFNEAVKMLRFTPESVKAHLEKLKLEISEVIRRHLPTPKKEIEPVTLPEPITTQPPILDFDSLPPPVPKSEPMDRKHKVSFDDAFKENFAKAHQDLRVALGERNPSVNNILDECVTFVNKNSSTEIVQLATEALVATKNVVQDNNVANLESFKKVMQKVSNHGSPNAKKVWGACLVIFGALLIAASVAALIGTKGLSTPLTIKGISIGVSLIQTGLVAAGLIVVAAEVGGGLLIHSGRQVSNKTEGVSQAMGGFFKKTKEDTQATVEHDVQENPHGFVA